MDAGTLILHLSIMHGIVETDPCIIFEGVTWEHYLQVDAMLGESRGVRLKFADDRLEIMSPSRDREHIKSNIGCMVEVSCRRNKLFFQTEGSATMKRPPKRGGEPDESYIFTKGLEEAQLVIEAALTSGGISKLDFYRGFPIPEVWIWEKEALNVFLFRDGDYHRSDRSALLPDLDLRLIERLADHPYTSEVLDAFEEALDRQ